MKKSKSIIVCFLCILLLVNKVYSKDYSAIIDSLKQVNFQIASDKNIKGKTLYNLSWYYYASQLYDSSICYSKQAFKYAIDKNIDTVVHKSVVLLGALYSISSIHDSAIHYLHQGILYFENINDAKYEKELAKIYSILANNYSELMNYKEAFIYYDKSEIIYIKTSDTAGLIFNKIAKGNLFTSLQMYDKALLEYNNAINFSKKSGKFSMLSSTYNNISTVYKRIGDKQSAKNYLFIAINYILNYENGGHFIGDSYHNLSLLYNDENNYDSASYYSGLAIKNFKKLHLLYREKQAFLSECTFYMAQGQLNKVQSVLDNIGEIPDQLKAQYFLIQSKLVYKKRDNDKAINYAHQALLSAQKNKDIEYQKNAYELLHEINNNRNDFKQALKAHEKFMLFKDSMFNQEKSIAVQKIIVENIIDEKDAEIKLKAINHEKELARKNKLIWIASSISIVLLLIVLVIYFMFKNKKQKVKSAKLERELSEKMFQNEIRAKEKELELNKNTLLIYTRHLLEKNTLLEELDVKLKELQSKLPDDQEKIEKINQLTSSKIITEDNWEQFKNLFGKVHEGFFFKLKNEYPGITNAESRLAALIKLNISSKKIASMVGISDDSVKKTRQRLRKKMQLETEEGLEEIIFKM